MVREVYDSLFFPSYLSFPLEGAMSFIMPPSAVTSTLSIIIILTTVHPFATSWPSSPKGDARTLRDWLSVSYVTQYPVPPIFSFPLKGKSREAGKGVRGRELIGCSIAVLTANRRPTSCGMNKHSPPEKVGSKTAPQSSIYAAGTLQGGFLPASLPALRCLP